MLQKEPSSRAWFLSRVNVCQKHDSNRETALRRLAAVGSSVGWHEHISHARSNAATLAPFKQLPLEEMWARMKEGTEEKVFTGSTPGPTRFFRVVVVTDAKRFVRRWPKNWLKLKNRL